MQKEVINLLSEVAQKCLDLIYNLCSEKITIDDFRKEVEKMGDRQMVFNFDEKETI